MKKISKIIAALVALLLIGGILWFANGLVGNPVSKMLAKNSAEKYIVATYPDMDLEITEVNYNFKDGGYYARVKSPSSIDTHFSLSLSMSGKVTYDYYENNVLGKNNTLYRINEEYRAMVDEVIDSSSFPYKSHIAFGDIRLKEDGLDEYDRRFALNYDLSRDDLELDKIYDVRELAKTGGYLVIYVEDEVVTNERAKEILLEITAIFDKMELPFFAIDFNLQKPRTPDDMPNPDNTYVSVRGFAYDDIYKEDFSERFDIAAKNLREYYAEEDAKKDMEKPLSK